MPQTQIFVWFVESKIWGTKNLKYSLLPTIVRLISRLFKAKGGGGRRRGILHRPASAQISSPPPFFILLRFEFQDLSKATHILSVFSRDF